MSHPVTSWFDTTFPKAILFIITVLCGLAVILPWAFAPRADLQATYRHVRFDMPERLQMPDRRDTAIARRDTVIDKLYGYLSDEFFRQKRYVIPDSMRPSNMLRGSSGYASLPIKEFAIHHSGLIYLTVSNQGSKALTGIKVVCKVDYNNSIYYQFKDAEGKWKAGSTLGRFTIGDLDPDETREITIWVTYPASYGSDEIRLVYSEGIITAVQPVELTGKIAWLVKTFFNVPTLFLILMILPIIVAFIGFLLKRWQATAQSTSE